MQSKFFMVCLESVSKALCEMSRRLCSLFVCLPLALPYMYSMGLICWTLFACASLNLAMAASGLLHCLVLWRDKP